MICLNETNQRNQMDFIKIKNELLSSPNSEEQIGKLKEIIEEVTALRQQAKQNIERMIGIKTIEEFFIKYVQGRTFNPDEVKIESKWGNPYKWYMYNHEGVIINHRVDHSATDRPHWRGTWVAIDGTTIFYEDI